MYHFELLYKYSYNNYFIRYVWKDLVWRLFLATPVGPTMGSAASTTHAPTKEAFSTTIINRLLDNKKSVAAYGSVVWEHSNVHGAGVGDD